LTIRVLFGTLELPIFEGKYVMLSALRLAKCGKSARLVGTRNNFNEAQSVKPAKSAAPEVGDPNRKDGPPYGEVGDED
jgi:hypothetical protein